MHRAFISREFQNSVFDFDFHTLWDTRYSWGFMGDLICQHDSIQKWKKNDSGALKQGLDKLVGLVTILLFRERERERFLGILAVASFGIAYECSNTDKTLLTSGSFSESAGPINQSITAGSYSNSKSKVW